MKAFDKSVHPPCPAKCIHLHTHTVCDHLHCPKSLMVFFAGIAWQQNDISVNRGWVGVGGMDGRMTPVSIPTGERKSLSEHNRKETEQKQAHVFLDIKSLPVGLWLPPPPSSVSTSLPSSTALLADREIDYASLFVCVKSVHAPVGTSLRYCTDESNNSSITEGRGLRPHQNSCIFNSEQYKTPLLQN